MQGEHPVDHSQRPKYEPVLLMNPVPGRRQQRALAYLAPSCLSPSPVDGPHLQRHTARGQPETRDPGEVVRLRQSSRSARVCRRMIGCRRCGSAWRAAPRRVWAGGGASLGGSETERLAVHFFKAVRGLALWGTLAAGRAESSALNRAQSWRKAKGQPVPLLRCRSL